MNKNKRCAICGNEFIPQDPRNKFCSLECKEIQRIRQRDKWREEHPDYKTKYMREYRARKKMEVNE